MLSLKISVVLMLFHLVSGEKLPKFFKICKKSEVNLSKCVEDNGNFVLPYIIEGVEELNIPPLRNLKIPKIYAPSYLPYNFNFEGNISDLEGVFLNDTVYDPKDLVARSKLIFPKLEFVGKYKLNGFVGKIPMTGNGPANITLHNVTLDIIWTFALFKHLGMDYIKEVSDSLISYNVTSANYNFGNLFDGDNTQGKIANQLLNTQWWILAGNFLPHVPVYLLELIFKVVSKVSSNTTINDVLLPF